MVTVDGETFLVEVEEISEGSNESQVPPLEVEKTTSIMRNFNKPEKREMENGLVVAPLPGVVSEIRVEVGQEVDKGSILLILDAMKMENEILAPFNGAVRSIFVEVGSQVKRGDQLARLK
jgi:biotin carboxyl carrier protein